MSSFSHLDRNLRAAMVDVGGKQVTRRIARARAELLLPPAVVAAFEGDDLRGPKGPVLQTAFLAGILAAKRTPELIPLCHGLALEDCRFISGRQDGNVLWLEAEVKTSGKTGVEMEAFTAVSIAALTVIDMCKALSPEIMVRKIRLMEKSGGRGGLYRASQI